MLNAWQSSSAVTWPTFVRKWKCSPIDQGSSTPPRVWAAALLRRGSKSFKVYRMMQATLRVPAMMTIPAGKAAVDLIEFAHGAGSADSSSRPPRRGKKQPFSIKPPNNLHSA